MISLTLFDETGIEIPFQTDLNDPIEIIIPRDANLRIPPLTRQNVTSADANSSTHLFNLHAVNLTSSESPDLNVSLHIEIQPMNSTLAYLFIFQYDTSPVLTSSTRRIDGWTIFCPNSKRSNPFSCRNAAHRMLCVFLVLNTDGIHTFYTANEKNFGHKTLIFGLRELNRTETAIYCTNRSNLSLPISDRSQSFTADYGLRTYTSGCYYLDTMNNWRSDGLRVSVMTFLPFLSLISLSELFRSDQKPIIIRRSVFPLI